MSTTTRRNDSKATREFWAKITVADRIADARGDGLCGTVYTTRDGGSELVCMQAKGHTDTHYSGRAS